MIVVGGRQVEGPFRSVSWLENADLRVNIPEDGRRRPEGQEVRALVIHSTKGKKTWKVLPGLGRPGAAVSTFRYWSGNDDQAGAHFVVDRDGTICQGADPVTEVTYHCPSVNNVSVGIEIYQTEAGEFWEGQLNAFADFVSWLSDILSIPKRVHFPYRGPVSGISQARGVYGHRDVTDHRGVGDPGDPPMLWLRDRSGFLLTDLGIPFPNAEQQQP